MHKEFNLTVYINNITGKARVDLNENFIYVNQKYCDITGYSFDERVGQNACILKHPDRDSFIIEKLWNTIQAENEFHFTFPDLTKSGQTIYIDDFRSFFRVDKTVTMIPLHETINLAISIVEHSFEKLGIAIIIQDESMDSSVAINLNEFSQVLINILNNARDVFADRGANNPTVKIILGVEQEQSFIKIQDNAGGIDSDIIPKIFDPYFTTKHQSQGTGLGLHMAKAIIEKHFDGELSVSNVDGGAEFLIRLPMSVEGSDGI